MSKTLFEEAVADANKLRELAEETAKNKVVEAVMPQIRDMINRKILGEDIDVEDEMPSIDIEDLEDDDDLEPYATLAGFVVSQLGRIPESAENFEWSGFYFEVVDTDAGRIDKVLVAVTKNADGS